MPENFVVARNPDPDSRPRYSPVFRLEHVRPGVGPDGLAERQVRHPAVPTVFGDTHALADEWTIRLLAPAGPLLVVGP